MRRRSLTVVCLAALVICAPRPHVPVSARPEDNGRRLALIISGIGASPDFERQFARWARALYTVLRQRFELPAEDIYYLTAENPLPTDVTINVARAQGDALARAFAEIEKKVTEKDVVFVFLIGHGSYDGERATFNVIGRDWTADDFARVIRPLKTRNIVFVNMASASGEFIGPLGRLGAIVITATRSGREQNATIFADHFIAALSDERADFDKNGRTSVLEAFTYAAQATAAWYARQGLLATEHPLLEDNGDGIGHGEAIDGEGSRARAVYLDLPTARVSSADPELRALVRRQQELERAIESLKARKAEMSPDDYERELERLAVELATVMRAIREKRK